MRQLFTPLYWLLFLLLAAIVALSLWSISSERGTVWLLEKVQALKPGMVEISGIHHSLVRGPSIDRLRFASSTGKRVVIEGISIDYQLAPLRNKQLHVKKLTIERMIWQRPVREKNAKSTSPDIELPTLRLPLNVTIEHLDIGEIRIEQPDKNPITIKNISLQGGFHHNTMRLDQLGFDYGIFSNLLRGNINFTESPQAILDGRITANTGDEALLHLQGRLQQYALSGTINSASRQYIPEATISFNANGDLSELKVQQLKANTLHGNIVANGKLRWQRGVEVEASFSGNNIDPGEIDPYYSGNINFGGQAHFSQGQLKTQVAMLGKMQGFPFQIETDADVNIKKQAISVRQGRLVMSSNLVKFSGEADRQAAKHIRFEADMPKLSALYPSLRGTITGHGNIDGKWLSPKVGLQLNAKSLRWKTIALDALNLNLQSTGQALAADFKLTAKGLRRDKLSLAEIRLTGHADESRQRGSLNIRDPKRELQAHLSFDGHHDRDLKRWNGTIDKMMLTALGLPSYRQREPATLEITPTALTLEQICLNNRQDRLCLEASLSKGQPSTLSARLEAFPLKHLKQWLPLTKYLNDTIDAHFDISKISEKIRATASAELDHNNQLAATISVDTNNRALAGNIKGRFDQLKWIEPISEGIMDPAGKINLAVRLGGTLSHPEMNGKLTLNNASVRLPAAGIKIENIDISATTTDAKSAIIDGSLTSGDGQIAVSGNIVWPTIKQWKANIDLTGKHFLATSLPMAKVWISPTLNIAAIPARIDVNGEVLIPEANIRFKRIPETAITPSDDVYFTDLQAQQHSSRLNVYSKVAIRLGDKVHLSGFGLNADLRGKLRITEAPGQAISGDGSLTVVNGYYEALGQKLDIERGEIYWNGPLNSPGLNLRAVRKIDGITTGLEISGPIHHPESRIFSNPVMDETNALAYLLTGKPFGASNQRDSNMLLTAVARLGLKGSASLVDDLRRRAGLDVLAIQPGEELEQSALVIGKYLSPRFYLEYTTSLFEDTSVLSMRYKLNRYLQLKAESSDKRQSIDLIYQIER